MERTCLQARICSMSDIVDYIIDDRPGREIAAPSQHSPLQYSSLEAGTLKLNEVYAAREAHNEVVVEKFLNKNYYNPEYMYNTEGPEVLRLYNAKDNTQAFTFTDVLDSVYYNVTQHLSSGFPRSTITRCSSAPSSTPLNPSGPSTTLTRRAPFHPASEENTRCDATPRARNGYCHIMQMHCLQTLRCCLPCQRNHHRERATPRRIQEDHALRHRYDQVHLLRVLPGRLPSRCHRLGS